MPLEDDSSDISSGGRSSSGRSFWGGLRAALFGEEAEASLRDQIEEVIDSSEDSGAPEDINDLSHVERQMLRNMLHFGEKTVGDVAVPRSDIIAVPCDIGFQALVAAFADAGHSRLPVYEDDLDRVVGMIHVKDVFTLQVTGQAPGDLGGGALGDSGGEAGNPDDIMPLLRQPLYVPESMGMPDLLARMRAERKHLAIVVDEFGGTEGLITIEDVVEEIVGDIEDEHDEEPVGVLIPLGDGLWDADARAELEEVAETIDPRLGEVDEDVDTLGGLASVLAGHVPQPGEVLEHPSGWKLEVTESDARRVTRLTLHPPEDALGVE